MNNIISIIILIIGFTSLTSAQGTAGENAKYEHRYLIDMPAAGIMERGSVGITTELLPFGTLIAKVDAGIFDNISIGLSYGGTNIIGSGKPEWYPFPPGVNLRFRIMDETILLPSLTLGFDTQGKGEYFKDEKRFAIKAPGIFAAVSKNFSMLGYLSLHGAMSYSILEDKDGDNFVNIMAGLEKTLGSSFSVLFEYNFAFNDNSTNRFGEGKGYMNFGIRWSIAPGVTAGFDLRDLLENKKWNPTSADRALVLEFVQKI
ncbi:MAG: YjbH domain-containing protein [Ignavibacterium sp.]|nr:YjbH domain-containing protein [Ignavibacterium sp.]